MRFVFSRDFRHAKITLRLRGDGYEGRGAALKFLAQGAVAGMEQGCYPRGANGPPGPLGLTKS